MRACAFELILPVFLIAFAASGHTQEACPDTSPVQNDQDVFIAFDTLLSNGALGGASCDTALCGRVKQWEDRPAGDAKVTQSASLLEDIRTAAMALPIDVAGVVNVQGRFAEWEILLLTNDDVALLPTAVWQPAQMELFSGHPDAVNFEENLADACGDDGTVGDCRTTFDVSTCAYSLASMQRRVLFELLEEERRATVDYLDLLNRRWASFNTGGRSLFPWELGINGWWYGRKHDTRGFVEPPSMQIVIAHPSIAIDYANAESGGMEEALVLEVLGWYRWRWGDDSSAIERPFGASVIATWTGGQGDVGYGVMVHLPKNWSIGVTRREILGEDETTVLVSVDLGKLIAKENGLRNELFEKLKQAIRER